MGDTEAEGKREAKGHREVEKKLETEPIDGKGPREEKKKER